MTMRTPNYWRGFSKLAALVVAAGVFLWLHTGCV